MTASSFHPISFLSLTTLLAVLFPLPVAAQVDILSNFFGPHPDALLFGFNFSTIISRLLPNVIMVAGVLLLLLTLRNGFNLITQAGKHLSPQELAKMKIAFSQSFIGFLLVVAAYFILQIISTFNCLHFTNPPNP